MGAERGATEEAMTVRSTILWRRLDLPGHELCELTGAVDGWRLSGVALVAHENRPCRLEYEIECDASWETRRARVRGQIGQAAADLSIIRAVDGAWSVNGSTLPTLQGCVDIDLGFSPSTNLLPIRRLAMAVGQHAAVRAAWVRFPELRLEVLEQTYTRIGPETYRYESAGGAFTRELSVDSNGFVLDYPGIWCVEAPE